jgi:hypothetical protein
VAETAEKNEPGVFSGSFFSSVSATFDRPARQAGPAES